MARTHRTTPQVARALKSDHATIRDIINELGLKPDKTFLWRGFQVSPLWSREQFNAIKRVLNARRRARASVKYKEQVWRGLENRYKVWTNPKFLARLGQCIVLLDTAWHCGVGTKRADTREDLRKIRLDTIRALHDMCHVAEIRDIKSPGGSKLKRIIFWLNRKLFTVYVDEDEAYWPINNTTDEGLTIDPEYDMLEFTGNRRKILVAKLTCRWFLRKTRELRNELKVYKPLPSKSKRKGR